MNRKKRIELIIKNNFNKYKVIVTDNSQEHSGHHNFDGLQESHFKITIKSDKILKKNRLNTHRMINSLLEEEFKSGLHALEIEIN